MRFYLMKGEGFFMISNKLIYASSVFMISGSIILAGGVIGKPLNSYEFCLADAIIIIGFVFIVTGLILMLLSFFKHKK